MAAPPKAVVRGIAQGIADLLTRQTFSQNFIATREWIAVNEIEEFDRFVVQVVPEEARRITRASRGANLHEFTIEVTAQKRLKNQSDGDVAPVKLCDDAADFTQELEDFLLDIETSIITSGDLKATPIQAEATWDKERLETLGIFAVNIAILYRLLR